MQNKKFFILTLIFCFLIYNTKTYAMETTYNINNIYPLFFLDVPLIQPEKIQIWVYESAWEKFSTKIFNSALNWNDISYKIKLITPVYGYLKDKEFIREKNNMPYGTPQINIESVELYPEYLALTSPTKDGQQRIVLNDLLSTYSEEKQLRTFQHEIGHALGLNHPNTLESSYKAIMWMTEDFLMSNKIEFQDKYNLIKRWE